MNLMEIGKNPKLQPTETADQTKNSETITESLTQPLQTPEESPIKLKAERDILVQSFEKAKEFIGCYFSLNSNMVTNEKNKEKLYLIPKTRVLIESDGPFTKIDGKKYTFNNLIKIYELVARYYNEPDIIKMVYVNFRDILSK